MRKKFYTKATSRSKTGYPGVYKTGGKPGKECYQARIVVGTKEIYLGCYDDIELAIAARSAAEMFYYDGDPYATTVNDYDLLWRY